MYYEVDQSKKKIRPLPGYFPGFKDALKGVDPAILSDFQADYIKIPEESIVEVSDEEYESIKRRQDEILTQLHEIDMKSIRPARAGETEKLLALEIEAEKLRSEFKEIQEA